jgi:hypothetical protein
MKKQDVYILIGKDHKYYKRKVQGQIIEVDNIKFVIIGDSKEGYNLTHYETGTAVKYYSKLKELKADLENIVFKFKQFPEAFLENGIYHYETAEIESEVKE